MAHEQLRDTRQAHAARGKQSLERWLKGELAPLREQATSLSISQNAADAEARALSTGDAKVRVTRRAKLSGP